MENMNDKIAEKDMKKIKEMVEKEFPNDSALQQIHIARKVIAKEAKLTGMSYYEYIKSHKNNDIR